MDISSIIYEAKSKDNTYCLITRRTWLELSNVFRSHIDLAMPNRVDKVNSVYHFKNGSRIYFGVIGDEESVSKHAGMLYHYFDTDSIDPEYAIELAKRIYR